MLLTVDGLKVKALRGELGLSRRECCRRAGISEKTLSNMEKSRNVRPSTVRSIAKVLGVNPRILASPKARLPVLRIL